jgi:hypothetical protein
VVRTERLLVPYGDPVEVRVMVEQSANKDRDDVMFSSVRDLFLEEEWDEHRNNVRTVRWYQPVPRSAPLASGTTPAQQRKR